MRPAEAQCSRTEGDPAGAEIALALRVEAGLAEADSALVIAGRGHRLTLRDPSPGLRTAVCALAAPGGETLDRLEEFVLAADGPDGLAVWYYQLDRLAGLGLLRHLVRRGGAVLLSAWAMQPPGLLSIGDPAARPCRMSRFAYARARDGVLLLETPLSAARVVLHDPHIAALLPMLARGGDVEVLSAATDLPQAVVERCLQVLAAAGIVTSEAAKEPEEERDPALRQWQFHDLLFHARSRLGRHEDAFGGTFRFRDAIAPLPAVPPGAGQGEVVLPRPDLAAIAARDLPLEQVMQARRSVRQHGIQPITLGQLGEFLFRVARIKQVIPPDPGRRRIYEVTMRPYPSGGATYDLEIYLTVDRCEGLPAGLYHYDALAHRLRQISPPNDMTERLIEGARLATRMPSRPQVLFTLASRFQRLSWKYETIAYAATLKNVGVLYQTMYLVATSMGLSPCALGGGDSDHFAAATGANYFTEGAVGEFMLGTRGDAE